jgi:hypothetical protein
MGVTIKDLVTSTVRVLGKPEYAETGLAADCLMGKVQNELQSQVTEFENWDTDDDTGLNLAVCRLVCREAIESLGLATTVKDSGHTHYRLTENGMRYFQDMTQFK